MRLTLEQTKHEKQWWEENVRTKQIEFDLAKKSVKVMEETLRASKKAKNKLERELKFGKKQVIKLDTRIKATPSRVRKWGKDHPGELINTLGGGKT